MKPSASVLKLKNSTKIVSKLAQKKSSESMSPFSCSPERTPRHTLTFSSFSARSFLKIKKNAMEAFLSTTR